MNNCLSWRISTPVGFCDKLLEKVDWILLNVAVVDCGEENKSLNSVARIWSVLSKRGARRSSILFVRGGRYSRKSRVPLRLSNGECVVFMYLLPYWRRWMHPWVEKPG